MVRGGCPELAECYVLPVMGFPSPIIARFPQTEPEEAPSPPRLRGFFILDPDRITFRGRGGLQKEKARQEARLSPFQVRFPSRTRESVSLSTIGNVAFLGRLRVEP